MTPTQDSITKAFTKAFEKLVPDHEGSIDPLLRRTQDAKFGDYQSNVAMSLAKKLGKKPRDLAEEIVTALELDDVCEKIEIAGPGFINLTLSVSHLLAQMQQMASDDRLGVVKTNQPQQHVIDFSSPNLAKEMHVGHLRTTITGEVIARVIEFAGHPLERINHVGDWGTQFGMLLEYLYESHPAVVQNPDQFEVKDLESFYKAAKQRFDDDEGFKERARQRVVQLQSGDEQAKTLWQAFLKESLRHCHEIYAELNVTLKDLGESFYNDKLAGVVQKLRDAGVATTDDGAVCVFLDGYKNRDGDPLPFIIQKSDGGYNYATTDLAALTYRLFETKAKTIIYVTDIRQEQHFKMLFETAQKAGWVSSDISLRHIGYGMVLGQDRKPFKTRDGGTVRLKQLIDEAIERARTMITSDGSRVQQFDDDQKEEIAKRVGLAAIKYADLSHNLASDYVFDWDTMLAMDGNTGPYMLYAYARIMSIGRKAEIDLHGLQATGNLEISHPAEIALAKEINRFGVVFEEVYQSLKPSHLTEYLYELSRAFSSFYDKKTGVSVLDAESETLKNTRLLLCALTARVLKCGLNLLSIDVVDAM